MERYPLRFAALALIVSVGAFLLYIPLMSLVVVALLATGMALTFVLGLFTGMAEAPERSNELPKPERPRSLYEIEDSGTATHRTLGVLSGPRRHATSGAR